MCKYCKFRDNPIDNNYKTNPCNTCVYWGEDGYREYRNYAQSNEPINQDTIEWWRIKERSINWLFDAFIKIWGG